MNVTSAAGIEFADRIQRSLRLVILDQQFYGRYQAGCLEIFVIANAFKVGVRCADAVPGSSLFSAGKPGVAIAERASSAVVE